MEDIKKSKSSSETSKPLSKEGTRKDSYDRASAGAKDKLHKDRSNEDLSMSSQSKVKQT